MDSGSPRTAVQSRMDIVAQSQSLMEYGHRRLAYRARPVVATTLPETTQTFCVPSSQLSALHSPERLPIPNVHTNQHPWRVSNHSSGAQAWQPISRMWPNLFKVPHLLALRIIGMYIQTGKVFISLHLDLRLKHSPNTSKLLPRGKLTYSEWQQCTSIPHLRCKILLLCLNMTFFHIYMIFFIAQTWTKRVVQLWFGSSFLRFIATKSSELCKILVSFCVTWEVANRICISNYL